MTRIEKVNLGVGALMVVLILGVFSYGMFDLLNKEEARGELWRSLSRYEQKSSNLKECLEKSMHVELIEVCTKIDEAVKKAIQ